jgi:hypothetical protein
VILTNRDPEKWWKSYNESLGHIWRSKRIWLATWLDPRHFGTVIPFGRRCVELALKGAVGATNKEQAKACFIEHYAKVRRTVPKEKLLEYQVGEGWGRLCAFLGDAIPELDFPRTNDTKAVLEMSGAWSTRIFRRAALRALLPLAVLVSIGVAIYARRV